MVESGGTFAKTPKMVPCRSCGLLFTTGSLRFHEKSCGTEETPPPARSPSARSGLIIVTPPNAVRMNNLVESPQSDDEADLEPLFDHTVRENDFDAVLFPESGSLPPSPSPSPPPPPHPLDSAPNIIQNDVPPPYCKSDTGNESPSGESRDRMLLIATPTASPISSAPQIENSNIATAGPTTVATLQDYDNFESRQTELDFGAETGSQPQGTDCGYIGSSTYDRQSPLTTCVLVDGELAPILPAIVETPVVPAWEARISSTSTQQPSPKVTFASTKSDDKQTRERRRSGSSLRSSSRSVGRSSSPVRRNSDISRREASTSGNSTNIRTGTPDVVSLSVHRSEISKLRHALTQHRKLAEDKLTKEREAFKIRLQKEKEEWQQSERAKERHATRQEKAEKELIAALHSKLDEANSCNVQHTKELKAAKNTIRLLESERSSYKSSKRTLTMEITQLKEALNNASQNEGKSQVSSLSKKEVQLLQQDLSKTKAELARERNKTEKLQQVMRSRQAQQRSSSEMMITTIEQREQKVQEVEQRLAVETETLSAQKQKTEELATTLEQKQRELERDMEQVNKLRGVAVSETSEIADLQRQVAGQQQFLEDRSTSLEKRMQELTVDGDRQTAELKRINREKERLEAHQELLKQREQNVLERERALGNSQFSGRKSPTGMVRNPSPSITSVIPVGIMSPSINKRRRSSGKQISAPPPPPPPSATSGKQRSNSFFTESDVDVKRHEYQTTSRSYSSASRESNQKPESSAFKDVTNIIRPIESAATTKYQPLKKIIQQNHPHDRAVVTTGVENYQTDDEITIPVETNIALLRKERGLTRSWTPSTITTPRNPSILDNENIVTRIVKSDLMRKRRTAPMEDTDSEFSYDVTHVNEQQHQPPRGATWKTPTSGNQRLRAP